MRLDFVVRNAQALRDPLHLLIYNNALLQFTGQVPTSDQDLLAVLQNADTKNII